MSKRSASKQKMSDYDLACRSTLHYDEFDKETWRLVLDPQLWADVTDEAYWLDLFDAEANAERYTAAYWSSFEAHKTVQEPAVFNRSQSMPVAA
ncbi:MAG: hypothetical protein JXB47_07270 [Anaerolineae bacterium]|nr:hypothetical protein [Anaerolineae bacterium]